MSNRYFKKVKKETFSRHANILGILIALVSVTNHTKFSHYILVALRDV